MLLARVVGPLRFIASTMLQKQRKLPIQQQYARNAGSIAHKGSAVKDPTELHYAGKALSFIMWFWILYHCWFEYDHLVPSYKYPDLSKFTDEELGIPPDDED